MAIELLPLIWQYITTDLSLFIFAKKVLIIAVTAYTSNIAGNTLREITRFIIKWMFGPVAAVEWGAKLLYFAVELGGSIAWAQLCN